MTHRSRITIGIAALSLVLVYLFPIWTISLEAPQYPEGIGLEIWIDTVKGQKQHDLANVNNLNHYIGMKRIEPESIPELKLMPWIIGFLIGFGVVTAAAGKRWLLYTWVAVFLVVCAVGLVDFYLWEYDYGHNLDQETAIIKIPGMSYQPPLIGSKQLLNFVATSWPAFGGLVAFLSLGTGFWVGYREWRGGKTASSARVAMKPAMALVALGLWGCEPTPRPLEIGTDRCEYCMMGVGDARFGGEVVLTTGKVIVFDAAECLAAYVAENELAVHSLWVIDHSKPGLLIPAEKAVYLRSPSFHSPMGLNVAAFEDTSGLHPALEVEVFDWSNLLNSVVFRDGQAHQPEEAHQHEERATLTQVNR